MKIEHNFITVQVSPDGTKTIKANCYINLSSMPECQVFSDSGFFCVFGTDLKQICEAGVRGDMALIVCEKDANIQSNVDKFIAAGKKAIYLKPSDVSKSTVFAKGYSGDPVLYMHEHGEDVCDALPAVGAIEPVVTVAVVEFEPEPEPEPVIEAKASKKKRARNESGEFKSDDPATPEVNEAWEAEGS